MALCVLWPTLDALDAARQPIIASDCDDVARSQRYLANHDVPWFRSSTRERPVDVVCKLQPNERQPISLVFYSWIAKV